MWTGAISIYINSKQLGYALSGFHTHGRELQGKTCVFREDNVMLNKGKACVKDKVLSQRSW